jgi:CRP-like cAMP-binding protein
LIKKRRDLVVDGYEYRKLCFVETGFAARYKVLRNGKRQILNVLLPGDVGLPGSFLERASYSVIAVTDMTLHVCSLDAYVSLCYRRPQFALALSWLAVQEAVFYAEHIIDAGRRTPIERLARFLLEIHSRLAMVGLAGGSSFELPFSQESHAGPIAGRRSYHAQQPSFRVHRSEGHSDAWAVSAAHPRAYPRDRSQPTP